MLRSRMLRLAMLAFSALWFGLLVPVHQRGVIRVAGTAASWRTCCATSTRDESKQKPLGSPSGSGCAVCQFIATLDLPPAIVIDVPSLGLLATTPVVAHASSVTAAF